MMQILSSAALIWSWALTPEVLVFVDRGGGMAGLAMIAYLGAGCILALLCSSVIHDRRLSAAAGGSDYLLMARVWGRFVSTLLVFAGRIPLLLLVSTGMLVTAGFAFNEIYLYWFPNFLFASLLLIGIGALHLFNERYALALQTVAALLVIGVLLGLVLLGTREGLAIPEVVPAAGLPVDLSLVTLGFICFLGFDFHRSSERNGVVSVGVGVIFLVLALWVWLVISRVAAETLASVDVAYMFVARSVAGEQGRHIMGAAVIGGAVCGVNGLFLVARRCFGDIARGLQESAGRRFDFFVVGFFVLAIVAMMLGGAAGDEVLRLQIRASIALWLVYLLGRILAGGYLLRQRRSRKGWLGYALAPLIAGMTVVLLVAHDDRLYLIVFLLFAATAAALLSLFCLRAAERAKKKRIQN